MNKATSRMASVIGGAVIVSMLFGTGCGANTTSNTASNQTSGSATQTSATNNTSTQQSKAKPSYQQWTKPPAMTINVNKQYDAIFHTNYGDFTVQLFAKDSPVTVNNFVFLAEHNYYHNNDFFRIIQPFMIQTGDPTNTGTGTPGYSFADELPPKYPYAPGIVAMANAGPNTNGSQFFICTGSESAGLNQTPNYTEFGKVIQGMNVVLKIAAIPVTMNPNNGEESMPTKKAVIESINIQSK